MYIQDEKETGEDSGNDTTLRTANSKLSLAACNAVDRQYVSYVSNVTCIVAVIISVEKPYFGAPSPQRPKTTSMCCTIIVSAALKHSTV